MIETSIADIVLRHDRRGIARIQPFLPADNYRKTAHFILSHPGPVILVTGFYVNGIAETDGPPGTLVLAQALYDLGNPIHLITDRYGLPLFQDETCQYNLIEFPITDESKSQDIARSLLEEIKPALVVAVERCGQTRHGRYCNMHGVDITPYTARLDHLFLGQDGTIGIGDGGNEIGMGLLHEKIIQLSDLISEPTVTATQHLLPASVSNWGAYGLVAALSELCGRNLLPEIAEQRELLHTMVVRGSTNGMTGKPEILVDGFDTEINDAVLADLHEYVNQKLTQREQGGTA